MTDCVHKLVVDTRDTRDRLLRYLSYIRCCNPHLRDPIASSTADDEVTCLNCLKYMASDVANTLLSKYSDDIFGDT